MITIDVKEHIEKEILDIQENSFEANKHLIPKLENLTDNDIKIIDEKLELDDELRKYIDETVNYYIYHLIEDKYSKRKENN